MTTPTTEVAMKRPMVVVRSEDGGMWGIWTAKSKRWQYFNAEDFERTRDVKIRAAKQGTLKHESHRYGPGPGSAA
jgi:hypothetical protein